MTKDFLLWNDIASSFVEGFLNQMHTDVTLGKWEIEADYLFQQTGQKKASL